MVPLSTPLVLCDQVAELLEPQQLQAMHSPAAHCSISSSGNCSAATPQQASLLLLLHQLSQLFTAMHALLQLYDGLDVTAAVGLKQGAVQLSLDVLAAVCPQGTYTVLGSTSAAQGSMQNTGSHTRVAGKMRYLSGMRLTET